jgi:hypothetical protein
VPLAFQSLSGDGAGERLRDVCASLLSLSDLGGFFGSGGLAVFSSSLGFVVVSGGAQGSGICEYSVLEKS